MHLHYDENGLDTGALSFSKTALLSHLKAKPSVVSIVPLFAREREEVEQFIKDIYAKAYGARIKIHYPVLMSVRNEKGDILAATGFRPAADYPLFLEQYLDRPVEQVLGLPRAEIVEIGNLASDGGGASLFLFAAISAYLHHKGLTQAVVTSTDFLEQRFKQMGLDPVRHAPADPSMLIGKDENWGTYYDTHPHVISGNVTHAYERLQSRFGAEYRTYPPRLFPRLHYQCDGERS